MTTVFDDNETSDTYWTICPYCGYKHPGYVLVDYCPFCGSMLPIITPAVK